MSKYTSNDADIMKMNKAEREDYENFMRNYDVEKYQEINKGVDLLMNPKKVRLDNLDHVLKIFYVILLVILLIVSILYILYVLWSIKTGKNVSNPTIWVYVIGCGLFSVVITLILVFFNIFYLYIKSSIDYLNVMFG